MSSIPQWIRTQLAAIQAALDALVAGTLPAGAVSNSEVAANAAIALSKLAELPATAAALLAIAGAPVSLAAAKLLTAADVAPGQLRRIADLGWFRWNSTSVEDADDVRIVKITAIATGRWEKIVEPPRVMIVDSIYDLAVLAAAQRSEVGFYQVRFLDQVSTILDTIVQDISADYKAHLALGVGNAHAGGADATNRAQDNGGDDNWTPASATPRHTQLNALMAGLPGHVANVVSHDSPGAAPTTLPAAITAATDWVGEVLAVNALIAEMGLHFPDVTDPGGGNPVHDAADNANVPDNDPISSANAKTATRYDAIFHVIPTVTTMNYGRTFRPFDVPAANAVRFDYIVAGPAYVVDPEEFTARIGAPCADINAAKALALAAVTDGQVRFIGGKGGYVWSAAEATAGDDDNYIVLTANGADPGRFVKLPLPGTIKDIDIAAGAAIALSKLAALPATAAALKAIAAPPVADVAAARALALAVVQDLQVINVGSKGLYDWKATDANPDDGDLFLALTENGANPGRLCKILGPSAAVFYAEVKALLNELRTDVAALAADNLVSTKNADPAANLLATALKIEAVAGLPGIVKFGSETNANLTCGVLTAGGKRFLCYDQGAPAGIQVYSTADGALEADLSTINGGADAYAVTADGFLVKIAHAADPVTGNAALFVDDDANAIVHDSDEINANLTIALETTRGLGQALPTIAAGAIS